MIIFKGITHIVVALGLYFYLFGINLYYMAGIIIGSLLPDIDTPYSLLGRYNPFSYITEHRGFTHTLLGMGVFSLFIYIIRVINMTIIIAGTVILALIHDASGTATLVAATLSVRGVTWITRKVTEKINLEASQIIDFAGWSIAGVSIVGIIGNAMGSINKVKIFFINTSELLGKFADIVDKITFWN